MALAYFKEFKVIELKRDSVKSKTYDVINLCDVALCEYYAVTDPSTGKRVYEYDKSIRFNGGTIKASVAGIGMRLYVVGRGWVYVTNTVTDFYTMISPTTIEYRSASYTDPGAGFLREFDFIEISDPSVLHKGFINREHIIGCEYYAVTTTVTRSSSTTSTATGGGRTGGSGRTGSGTGGSGRTGGSTTTGGTTTRINYINDKLIIFDDGVSSTRASGLGICSVFDLDDIGSIYTKYTRENIVDVLGVIRLSSGTNNIINKSYGVS